jgi:hypothetical protein
MGEKMKSVIGRPSPAMVIAIVALIAALGGSAIAGGVLNKKKVKKVANNVVTKRAPGLAVKSADSAKSADTAKTATTAGTATIADNLADQSQQIRAWASIDETGTILASKNVISVVQDGDGRYCFDTPFTPSAAVATLDGANANLNQTILTATDSSPCPAGNQDVRVSTGTPGGDSTVNQGFFVFIN